MRRDLIDYLDCAIETLESLLRKQIEECRRNTSQPCSVSGYGESIPSGIARLQALRRTRRVLKRQMPLERAAACRREAARYAKGGSDWCAVQGQGVYGHLRREGFAIAATDLETIVTLAACRGKVESHAARPGH